MVGKLADKHLKEGDTILKKVLVTAMYSVMGMVTLMPLLGPIRTHGFSADLLQLWLQNIPINFTMAYPLQVIIAGPLIGTIFRKLFPLGTLVDPVKVD
jgi:hypothetical protein